MRTLFGLKSAGASWRAALATILAGLGFESTKANVRIQKAVRPDGFQYYEMLLVFVDDILALSHEAGRSLVILPSFTGQRKEVSNHWISTLD
jgi:hypothetical protein